MSLFNDLLFVAWHSPETQRVHPVGRLVRATDGGYEFAYIRGARTAAREGFVPFVEFPYLDAAYASPTLFPLFTIRVIAASRPDYAEHLARVGLGPNVADPIRILARSGGRRTTDRVEVFGPPQFDPASHTFVYRFFLRGVRHVAEAEERIARLHDGDRLRWANEPTNEFSRLAVVVTDDNSARIGWVAHVLTDDLRALDGLGARLEIFADRINRPPAPVGDRMLCRIEAVGAPDFVPFSSETYAPIPQGLPRLLSNPSELVA